MWEWMRRWLVVLMGIIWMVAGAIYLMTETAHVISGATLLVGGGLTVGIGFLMAEWERR